MNAPLPIERRAMRCAAALNELPLVAVLSGAGRAQAEDAAAVLYDAGWRMLAISADDHDAPDRLGALRDALPADACLGIAQVTHPARWRDLRGCDADWALTPVADPALIGQIVADGCACIAGAMTPTEAHAALQAGASAIALYPAAVYTPPALRAVRRLLPASVPVLLHGDCAPVQWPAAIEAGLAGVVPEGEWSLADTPPEALALRARQLAQAWRQARCRA